MVGRFARRIAGGLILGVTPALSVAQSTLDSPENLSHGWTAGQGTVQFNFLHRFSMGPAPFRKITNAPTFTVATGLLSWLTVGTTYLSNSDVIAEIPNEWESFVRIAPLQQDVGAPFDAFFQGAWNDAAESVDGSLVLGRRLGRARVVALAGVLGNAFRYGPARPIYGAGGTFRLTSLFALAGDAITFADRENDDRVAWSAGIQLGVKGSPHSLSLHASNVSGRTLQGIARGSGETRWGFEYTVPITPAKYRSHAAHAAPSRRFLAWGRLPEPIHVLAKPVTIDIRNMKFSRGRVEIPAGTTVTWRNRDPLAHTITADTTSATKWTSGVIDTDAAYSYTFETPGTYSYHCEPHPFMKGTIIVTAADGAR